LVRSNILGPQLEGSALAITGFCKAIDREAQVWQHVIVNDVVEKNSVRVERLFRQDDAVIE
jgi:hypothetical protein